MKDNPNCGQWHPWGTCPDCREEEAMSSKWNHAQCTLCWDFEHMFEDEPRVPFRVKWEAVHEGGEEEVWCCFCRDLIDETWDTEGVIYVRADPAKLSCADLHPQEVT